MRVKLSDDTYEYIKQQVVDMFQEYEIQCVLISAFEISSKLNIPLIPYSALSADKREASMKISSDGFHEQTKTEFCGLSITTIVPTFNKNEKTIQLCTR